MSTATSTETTTQLTSSSITPANTTSNTSASTSTSTAVTESTAAASAASASAPANLDEFDWSSQLDEWRKDPVLAFELGVELAVKRWEVLNLAIENGWGSNHSYNESIALREELIDNLIQWFIDNNGDEINSNSNKIPSNRLYWDDISEYLLSTISTVFHTNIADESDIWLSKLLVQLYSDCFDKQDFNGIFKMLQTNKTIQQQLIKARNEAAAANNSNNNDSDNDSEDYDSDELAELDREEKESIEQKSVITAIETEIDQLLLERNNANNTTNSNNPSSTATATVTDTATSTTNNTDSDGWTTVPSKKGNRNGRK